MEQKKKAFSRESDYDFDHGYIANLGILRRSVFYKFTSIISTSNEHNITIKVSLKEI